MSEPLSTAAPALAGALSVGELTGHIKAVLEGTFPRVRVYGEVLGLTRARSGHIYFTLKDDTGLGDAQISVALWRNRATALRFRLDDGLRVVVEGRLGVYEPRGTYQILADAVRPAGRGALLVAFERLKARLWKEGLFDPSRKRPLPFLPDAIALITSPTGAAVHDVLRSLERRFPCRVRLLPVRVQGAGAADEIAAAFEFLRRWPGVADLAILARGGGSLEDLWAFNEEKVARAVAASPVPTVCGVGHEVDVTLADLAADVRAQTPTHAGEIAVPEIAELRSRHRELGRRLGAGLRLRLDGPWQRLHAIGRVLALRSPRARLDRFEDGLRGLGTALQNTLYNRLRRWQDQLSLESEKLRTLSPLDVLHRGYALVLNASGSIVRSARELRVGETLTVLLGEGEAEVRVLGSRDSRGPRGGAPARPQAFQEPGDRL